MTECLISLIMQELWNFIVDKTIFNSKSSSLHFPNKTTRKSFYKNKQL